VEEEGGHDGSIAEGETAVTGGRREQATGDRQQAAGKWKKLEKRLH
jgi:uncharacterized protein YjbJ (UPF0337 family)